MNRTELADAMLKGSKAPFVREHQMQYVSVSEKTGFCKACALGCALIGKLNGDYHEAERLYDAEYMKQNRDYTVYNIFAEFLDIDPDFALEIEFRHLNGETIEQIAAWLKSSDK